MTASKGGPPAPWDESVHGKAAGGGPDTAPASGPVLQQHGQQGQQGQQGFPHGFAADAPPGILPDSERLSLTLSQTATVFSLNGDTACAPSACNDTGCTLQCAAGAFPHNCDLIGCDNAACRVHCAGAATRWPSKTLVEVLTFEEASNKLFDTSRELLSPCVVGARCADAGCAIEFCADSLAQFATITCNAPTTLEVASLPQLGYICGRAAADLGLENGLSGHACAHLNGNTNRSGTECTIRYSIESLTDRPHAFCKSKGAASAIAELKIIQITKQSPSGPHDIDSTGELFLYTWNLAGSEKCKHHSNGHDVHDGVLHCMRTAPSTVTQITELHKLFWKRVAGENTPRLRWSCLEAPGD